MAWISWSNNTSDDAKDANTVSDKEWRDIQGRALKANPKLKDTFSKESRAGRDRGDANYRNRKAN